MMDDESLPDDVEDVTIQRVAMRHFERALKALNELTDAVEEGDVEAGKRSAAFASDLRKATQTLFDERHRVAGILKGDSHDPTPEFDLDDARADILGRLGRLSSQDGSE